MPPDIEAGSIRKWLWMFSVLVPPIVTWFAGSARRDLTIDSSAELRWMLGSLAGGWICLWVSLGAYPLPGLLKWLFLGVYAIVFGAFLMVLSMIADNLSFLP